MDTTVLTDHKALCHLNTCKLLHGRITWWILASQEYNLIIEHVPGKAQIVMDALSRDRADIQGTQAKEFQIRSLREHMKQVDTGLWEITVQLKTEIREDSLLQKVAQELEPYFCRDIIKNKFMIKDEYLLKMLALLVQNGFYAYPIISGRKLVSACIVNVDIMRLRRQ
ncbi:hypothetical protein PR048_028652 [Dryococelus australis]|uniref:Reverse transcriptase RNase H-like domain-containing protein n=1 Tax=Dryococelus australis TaxID=614101 RepID=A0ABQ9GB62_9NEOP|nr:hypothetical protein PR048_028652 [Dryococelus australis]